MEDSTVDMEFLEFPGRLAIETRQRGRVLSGAMPYNKTFTRSDRGAVRKERFKSNAFNYQIRRFAEVQKALNRAIQESIEEVQIEILRESLDRANINILSSHSFREPLGDLKSGSATITSNNQELAFEVLLPEPRLQPVYIQDLVKQIEAGLVTNISPGFRSVPPGVVDNAERLVRDPGENVMTREISEAVLFEISTVTRGSAPLTTLEVRSETNGRTANDLRREAFLWL